MRKVVVKRNYSVLSLDGNLDAVDDPCDGEVEINQFKGDELELWKEGYDGVYFVYCNRMEIGYWVRSSLVEELT